MLAAKTLLTKPDLQQYVAAVLGGVADREGNDTSKDKSKFKRTQSIFSNRCLDLEKHTSKRQDQDTQRQPITPKMELLIAIGKRELRSPSPGFGGSDQESAQMKPDDSDYSV